MSACGKSEPPDIRAVPTLKASKPKPSGVLPEPGERRPMPVVAVRARADLWLPSVFSAFGKAEVASEGRYTYPEVAIKDSLETRSSNWSYGGELALRSDSAPAIVNFGQGDFIDLVETESLLPLDQHFKDDSNFDPDAYWPGVLAAGQFRGVQYALPYGVGVWVVAFSDNLAEAVRVSPRHQRPSTARNFCRKQLRFRAPGRSPVMRIPRAPPSSSLRIRSWREKSTPLLRDMRFCIQRLDRTVELRVRTTDCGYPPL